MKLCARRRGGGRTCALGYDELQPLWTQDLDGRSRPPRTLVLTRSGKASCVKGRWHVEAEYASTSTRVHAWKWTFAGQTCRSSDNCDPTCPSAGQTPRCIHDVRVLSKSGSSFVRVCGCNVSNRARAGISGAKAPFRRRQGVVSQARRASV